MEEEKEAEIVGNENMKGFLSIKKENIDSNEDKGIGSLLTGGVGAIGKLGGNLVKGKPYFEIKKGVLY